MRHMRDATKIQKKKISSFGCNRSRRVLTGASTITFRNFAQRFINGRDARNIVFLLPFHSFIVGGPFLFSIFVFFERIVCVANCLPFFSVAQYGAPRQPHIYLFPKETDALRSRNLFFPTFGSRIESISFISLFNPTFLWHEFPRWETTNTKLWLNYDIITAKPNTLKQVYSFTRSARLIGLSRRARAHRHWEPRCECLIISLTAVHRSTIFCVISWQTNDRLCSRLCTASFTSKQKLFDKHQ